MRTLSERISDAGLSPAVARTFANGLLEVAGIDGEPDGDEAALVARLLGDIAHDVAPAPFEALWGHAELFLTACVYVAVIDGNYGIEEARRLSEFAHGLGFSAHQLAGLEARVFRELQERGARVIERERELAREAAAPAEADAPDPPALLPVDDTETEEVTELDVHGSR